MGRFMRQRSEDVVVAAYFAECAGSCAQSRAMTLAVLSVCVDGKACRKMPEVR